MRPGRSGSTLLILPVEEHLNERNASRWWVLASVVLVNVFVVGIAWNYVIMFVPALTADLGLEISAWGPLWSGIPLGVLLFSMPAGAVGDRFGARTALFGGLLLAASSLFLRASASTAVTLFASMVLFGLGLALIMSR